MKKYAAIFPGQGSQFVGMLQGFMENKIVKDTFNQANDALGYDLLNIVLNGPELELNKTEVTQPAILAASIAAYRAFFDTLEQKPQAFAGHSLGEYSALVAAGCINFEDALRLVRLRGQAMQEVVPQGQGAMMAVLGLDNIEVDLACKEASIGDDAVWAANYNSVGQIVISGCANAVSRAGEILTQKGAKKVVPLSVSAPSHCPLMQKAADKLKEALAKITINDASTAVYANAYAKPLSSKDEILEALILQLTGPVHWVQTIERMHQDGIEACVEFGPGKVLCGLNRRIVKSLIQANVCDEATMQNAIEALQ